MTERKDLRPELRMTEAELQVAVERFTEDGPLLASPEPKVILDGSVEADFVHALDLHKAEIKRLRAMVCECGHPEFFQADLHEEGCPARPDWEQPT